MILPLLLSLVGPLQAEPPIRISLNHEQFTRGDRARVYVQTVQDGHLVVLHADPDGRVRVLFPLDPSDDDFVRGGKRREIRGRSDRDALFVDATDGSGTVLAVLSPDPLTYDTFVRNDHWDYRALGATELRDDPLAGLLDIAQRMAGETRFEYDAATYVVGSQIASHYGYGYGSDYGYRSRFGIGLSFGYPYRYDPFCYDPWGWSVTCSGYGFGYSGFYGSRPYVYGRYRGGWPRGFGVGGGSRFVIPRDRVPFTGIEPRRRVGSPNPTATPRGIEPRQRGLSANPGAIPRGPRAPSMAPRGGRTSRGPTMSRPSGARGQAGRGGGGGGGRRH